MIFVLQNKTQTMSKKKRRQMRFTLTLSVMIAAIPLSLALFCDSGNDLPVSMSYIEKQHRTEVSAASKILPILANK